MYARRLANKVALVTGSSTGIGRAIALQFAAEHARLVVCADLTATAPEGTGTDEKVPTHELISQNHKHRRTKAIFVRTDVGIEEDLKACVSQATKQIGRLDM